MDTAWVSIIPDEVNRRVVAPHDRVCFVAVVPGKTEGVSIERRCPIDVLDMKHRGTLDKLCRIRGWKCRHYALLCLNAGKSGASGRARWAARRLRKMAPGIGPATLSWRLFLSGSEGFR